jgi:hypothetical protein
MKYLITAILALAVCLSAGAEAAACYERKGIKKTAGSVAKPCYMRLTRIEQGTLSYVVPTGFKFDERDVDDDGSVTNSYVRFNPKPSNFAGLAVKTGPRDDMDQSLEAWVTENLEDEFEDDDMVVTMRSLKFVDFGAHAGYFVTLEALMDDEVPGTMVAYAFENPADGNFAVIALISDRKHSATHRKSLDGLVKSLAFKK